MGGQVVWSFTHITANVTALVLRFDEEGDEPGVSFEITLSKRFFGRDMLRVREQGEQEDILMEANTDVVLAYITF
jgi:hypothetical protein